MLTALTTPLNQLLPLQLPDGITLWLKRVDQVHPQVLGNKFYKLKNNLIEARRQGQQTLLTFGGAYSNHIAAVAAAGQAKGFNTIGIIRGEELADKVADNSVLAQAAAQGMQLHFVSRSHYRSKSDSAFIAELHAQFGDFYLLPEGGTNALAVQGCSEILTPQDKHDFDVLCCAVGTGGTIAGIIESSHPSQRVLGFPALKRNFLQPDIAQWTMRDNWDLCLDYHFGGYAKSTPALLAFVEDFQRQTGIVIEPIYTGKMLYGILDLIGQGYFPPRSRILAIHTGGVRFGSTG
jgi:1-aminocyclopropane-1-carboxylate deaminase